jgi:GMP synthase-like glutamine amidotransferase
MKNILVLQHIAIEDPGYIKDLMEADGFRLTDEHPWLVEEKKRIREWVVDLQKPFLGFCLGCQLLGEVLGGKVQPSDPPEIGVLDIDMTPAARQDSLFGDYPQTIAAVQWHSYEVCDLENNAEVTVLGSSDSTRYQIFKYREHAYAVQFHIEVRADTVMQWGCVPEYRSALVNSLGTDALEQFDQRARAAMPEIALRKL